MTKAELAEALGCSRPTLYKYLKYPNAPAVDDLPAWKSFLVRHRSYPSERGERTDLEPTVERAESFALPDLSEDELLESSDGFDSQAEKRERVIKLRIHNETAREQLKLVRRETLTVKETQDTLAQIAATVKAELLELSGLLSESLAGRGAAEIQSELDSAHRKILEKLSFPEAYFEPKAKTVAPIK